MEQSPSWEDNRFSVRQEIPRILLNPKVTAVTSARHLSLSWASSIQSMTPHPTTWRSILHQSATFPYPVPDASSPRPPIPFLCQPHYLNPPIHTHAFHAFCPSGFTTKPSMHSSAAHTCHIPHPPHHPELLHPSNIWQHKSRSSSLCSYLRLLLLSPTYAHMFSSAPCSRTHSSPFFRQLRNKNSKLQLCL